MELAPIALFVYRRPRHTRRALESLLSCEELARSQLYVYCDAAKDPAAEEDVREARRVAKALAPAGTVFVERERNIGLARSIVEGTTDLTARHGAAIIVEDDLEVAPTFLRFLNAGLERYADEARVMQISGYQFPLVPPLEHPALFSFTTSWGWATWSRAWQHFDAMATGTRALETDPSLRQRFDLDGSYPYFEMLQRQQRGEIDSWAIRWHLSVFMQRGLVLFPARSLVKNHGFDGSGTHGRRGHGFDDVVEFDNGPLAFPEVALDESAQRRVFEVLRDARERSGRNRALDIASRWTNALLDNRFLPGPLRAVGKSLRARLRTWRSERP